MAFCFDLCRGATCKRNQENARLLRAFRILPFFAPFLLLYSVQRFWCWFTTILRWRLGTMARCLIGAVRTQGLGEPTKPSLRRISFPFPV